MTFVWSYRKCTIRCIPKSLLFYYPCYQIKHLPLPSTINFERYTVLQNGCLLHWDYTVGLGHSLLNLCQLCAVNISGVWSELRCNLFDMITFNQGVIIESTNSYSHRRHCWSIWGIGTWCARSCYGRKCYCELNGHCLDSSETAESNRSDRISIWIPSEEAVASVEAGPSWQRLLMQTMWLRTKRPWCMSRGVSFLVVRLL